MIILYQIIMFLQNLYYLVRNYQNGNLIKIIGDVIYGLGIGVAGNGFYDLFNTGTYDLFTVSMGFLAIIIGAILKK